MGVRCVRVRAIYFTLYRWNGDRVGRFNINVFMVVSMSKYWFWFENENFEQYYIEREYANDGEAFDAQFEMDDLAQPGYEYIGFYDEGRSPNDE